MRSPEPEASPLSRWSSRLALFSLLLIIAAGFLHRLFGMPTPVAANVVFTALAGAGAALLLGLAAGIQIWRSGGDGAARVFVGTVLSLILLGGPFAVMAMARSFPPIYDVTTDTVSPPPFDVLSVARTKAENSASYPGDAFAKMQARAYPDLKPMTINRSESETFELVVDALKRQKLHIVREQEPNPETRAAGFIEAVDRTLVLGFYEDVAIRVTGDAERARVDLRSASRFGSNDFGQNADRLRLLMKEIVARLEETVPTADGERPERAKRSKVKQEKAASPKKPAPRRPKPLAQ